MTLFWVIWLLGCVVVAAAMELIKLNGNGKRKWNIIGGLLTVVMTTSVWFGMPDHVGNVFILPALYICGYVIQFVVDMVGAKKVIVWIVNAWLSKHGYEKVKVEET